MQMEDRQSAQDKPGEWASSLRDELCQQFERLLGRLDRQDELLEDLRKELRITRERRYDSTGELLTRTTRFKSTFHGGESSVPGQRLKSGVSHVVSHGQTGEWESTWSAFEFTDGPYLNSCEPESDLRPSRPSVKDFKLSLEPWKLTKSTEFEIFFGVLIVLNAIWIGVETDYEAKHKGTERAGRLGVVTHLFSLAFLIELATRFIEEKSMFCKSRGDVLLWNIFDLVLVMGSVLEFALFLIAHASDQQTTDGAGNLQNLRLIRMSRLIRLMRLLRMARLVRFVRALRVLVHSIGSTLKSLLWAMFLLTGIMYFFAVMFTEATNEHLAEVHDSSGFVCAIEEDSWQLFGTIPRSMFTLFKAISNGIDWGVCTCILGDMSGVWVTTFVAYIAFAYFAVLNVVTGVFCQKAIESAQRDRELVISTLLENRQAHVDNIKSQFEKIFAQLDSDGSGMISLDEFRVHMDDDKVSGFFILLDIDASDAFALFKLLDDDGSGAIDADEFVEGCLRLQGTARSIDLAKVRHECKNMMTKMHKYNLTQDKRIREVMVHQMQQLDYVSKNVDLLLALSSSGEDPMYTISERQEDAHCGTCNRHLNV